MELKYYKIGDNEVPLFPMKYLRSIFNYCDKDVIYKKEKYNILPPANFRSEDNHRLYSVEDLALIEYIYKEIYHVRFGVKTPEWVKELAKDAFAVSKQVVLNYGKSTTSDNWEILGKKYRKFNPVRAQLYVDMWRSRCLADDDVYEDLVFEEEDE